MWDRRNQKPINQFNLAQRKVNHITCDPFNANQFAASYKDGRVDIWDINNNSQPLYSPSNSTHTGETTYLDWHPQERGVLLSGGQDYKIKAVNILTDEKDQKVFSISTTA